VRELKDETIKDKIKKEMVTHGIKIIKPSEKVKK